MEHDELVEITDAFANVEQGLEGENRTQMLEYWQRAIDEIEQIPDNGTGPDVFKTSDLPLARIKKVMKTDSEVKMIAAEAPVLFAKACEIFISELAMRAWIHAKENKRRTLQRSDIATAIQRSDVFDFLIDIVPREEAHTRRSREHHSNSATTQTVQKVQAAQHRLPTQSMPQTRGEVSQLSEMTSVIPPIHESINNNASDAHRGGSHIAHNQVQASSQLIDQTQGQNQSQDQGQDVARNLSENQNQNPMPDYPAPDHSKFANMQGNQPQMLVEPHSQPNAVDSIPSTKTKPDDTRVLQDMTSGSSTLPTQMHQLPIETPGHKQQNETETFEYQSQAIIDENERKNMDFQYQFNEQLDVQQYPVFRNI